jgi:4-hydroxyphenylpyruvate dioxygenase
VRLNQLAINSVSTRHQNLKEALEAYSGAGFQNVEFVLPHVKGWMNEGRSLAEVKSLLADLNLRAIGGFEAGVECFSSPESQERNHALHLGNAQLIHDLGGGTLVVGTDGPGSNSLEALETAARVFQGLAQKMEGLNVAIAIEFNWSPFVKSLKSAARIAELADHPQVGVLFDPAHYYVTSTKFEHLTPETVRWIKHCHFNDMRDKPGELSDCNGDRVLPGEGVLDLAALIERLETCGYVGYYSIEMFNEDLWRKPAQETAALCYRSMLPFCR